MSIENLRGDLLAADLEFFDIRSALRLPLPGRRDAPVVLPFAGSCLTPWISEEVVDIDAIDNVRLGISGLRKHDNPWLVLIGSGRNEAWQRGPDAVWIRVGGRSSAWRVRVWGARQDVLQAISRQQRGLRPQLGITMHGRKP